MEIRDIRVMVGGLSAQAYPIAEFLKSKGISVMSVEKNPLAIQFEASRHMLDAVIIPNSIQFPELLCENLKKIDEKLKLVMICDTNADEYKSCGQISKYLDAEIKRPCTPEQVYFRLVECITGETHVDPKICTPLGSTEDGQPCSLSGGVELHNRITEILTQLCIMPKYNGYNYIREAVKLAISESGGYKGISKAIYPEIARRLDVTPSGVERSIRTAIHRSWPKSEPVNRVEIFGTCALHREWIPTNSEFIFIIADKISCEFNAYGRRRNA